jgi:hypothetical protein
MARKARKPTTVQQAKAAMRRANHEAYVAAMREGRRERAATFADRRKVADRNACRGRHGTDD